MTNLKLIFQCLKTFILSGLALFSAILTAFFPAKTKLGEKINQLINQLKSL